MPTPRRWTGLLLAGATGISHALPPLDLSLHPPPVPRLSGVAKPSPYEYLTATNCRLSYSAFAEQEGFTLADGPCTWSPRAPSFPYGVTWGKLILLARWLAETSRIPDRRLLAAWLTHEDEMVRWFAYLALSEKLGKARIEACDFHPMYPLGAEENRLGLERIRTIARWER